MKVGCNAKRFHDLYLHCRSAVCVIGKRNADQSRNNRSYWLCLAEVLRFEKKILLRSLKREDDMQNACRLNCLLIVILILFLLFLMAQRYKFEGKSQPSGLGFGFRVLDWLPVFQSMLLLVVGNCRYLRLFLLCISNITRLWLFVMQTSTKRI